MSVELVKTEAEWSLVLGGAVDIFDVNALHVAACDALTGAPGGVVLRLDRMESVDTAVTQVVLGLWRALREEGRTVSIEGIPASVQATWRLAGLAEELGSG